MMLGAYVGEKIRGFVGGEGKGKVGRKEGG